MKRWYKDVNFRPQSLHMIKWLNDVIAGYQKQGLVLTLRQLYYVGVSSNKYPNTERSYKNLGNLVSDARLAGLMDWSAIEDRVRRPRAPSEFANLPDLVNAAVHSYRLPRWEGQENYVELWVEKDALAGVLAPIAHEYHVTMMVNRGYSSSSAMHEAANRFLHECKETGKRPHLLYLGDMDPSGEDMVRDVSSRLSMFGVEDIEVRKVALTMPQVKHYAPPPNPAKMSDSRAKKYVEEHGKSSWEVDALPPPELGKLIRAELDQLVDRDMMDKIMRQEDADKAFLRSVVSKNKELQ